MPNDYLPNRLSEYNEAEQTIQRQEAYMSEDQATSEAGLPNTLSAPARRALAAAGYTRLVQLTNIREDELLKLHGMGPKALEQLRLALAAHGLAFAQNGA